MTGLPVDDLVAGAGFLRREESAGGNPRRVNGQHLEVVSGGLTPTKKAAPTQMVGAGKEGIAC
jgi:hypothetical protein